MRGGETLGCTDGVERSAFIQIQERGVTYNMPEHLCTAKNTTADAGAFEYHSMSR